MALVINRFYYRQLGKKAVGELIPLTEEFLKTGFGWALGASILATHGVFGFIEFFWDLFQPGRGQWLPGLMGFLSHLFFGLVTEWVHRGTGSLLLGILAAGLFHSILNRFMLSVGNKEGAL